MIELERVARHFRLGDQVVAALDDVSLTIERGEYVAVMGPSGSGKSTLLNVIALLDRPTAGTYRLEGRAVAGLPDDELARLRRETFGFVFQFFHLIPRLTAEQNVAVPLMLAGVPARERLPRVRAALERFGLAERMQHRPDQLSGGQRQRVAIARATILEPAVLLADEPTGNLDSRSGAQVIALLEALNAQGTTLVVVTHDEHIGQRARRRLRLLDGRVVADERSPDAA